MTSANPATASTRSTPSAKPVLISFAVIPAFGHVYPVMPLAEAVRAAGARVQIAVGRPFEGTLPVPTVLGSDLDPTAASVPRLTYERFPAAFDDMPNRWLPAFFGVVHALPAVAALRRAWREDRPDLVVYDSANPGAAVVAEELGIPSMVFNVSQYLRAALDLTGVTRRALEHPEVEPWAPLSEPVTLHPYLDPVPAALQLGPIGDHPEVIPIRPVAWEDPRTAPARLPDRSSGRPLIYLTFGTVVGTPDLLREVILQAARVGDVLASTGANHERDQLGDLPDNVVVHRFVPARAVLAVADVVIHHGGMGTTLAAAAQGVPQLLLPQRGDQFVNGQAVTKAGIGTALTGPRADGAIGDALTMLHTDSGVRDATRAVARDLAAMPAPELVAENLVARARRARE